MLILWDPTTGKIHVISWMLLFLSCLDCRAFTTAPLAMPSRAISTLASSIASSLPTANVAMHASLCSSLIASSDIALDEAFQDTVSLTDGPIRTILIAFGVFVVVAVGLKTMMGKMDNAIEQVIRDFEATMKAYYSKRWRAIEMDDLQGLEGYERDIRVLQVMEQMQTDEPEFMAQLATRGAPPKVADTTIVETTAESIPDKK